MWTSLSRWFVSLEHGLPTNHPKSETALFFDLELVTARITPATPSSVTPRNAAAYPQAAAVPAASR
jgi:hypothetical protein